MKRRNKKFAKIVPNQVVLHGTDRFEPGKAYRVPIALARYFERNGWLKGSVMSPPADDTLDIHDATAHVVIGYMGGDRG